MKIILDDTYTLKGDAYCCWITEKRVTEEGKEYEFCIKFCRYTEECWQELDDGELRECPLDIL